MAAPPLEEEEEEPSQSEKTATIAQSFMWAETLKGALMSVEQSAGGVL